MFYKIYGCNNTGYQLINVMQDLEIAYNECHELQTSDYNKILLIESDGTTDKVVDLYFHIERSNQKCK